jgi:hypothetical protein
MDDATISINVSGIESTGLRRHRTNVLCEDTMGEFADQEVPLSPV